jgi:hypothetical protein
VVDRDAEKVVPLAERRGDPGHLRLGHALVGLVLEADDLAAA